MTLALTWHFRTVSSARGRPTPRLWLPSGDTVMGSGLSGLPLGPPGRGASPAPGPQTQLSAPEALSSSARLCGGVTACSCDQPAAGLGGSDLTVSVAL